MTDPKKRPQTPKSAKGDTSAEKGGRSPDAKAPSASPKGSRPRKSPPGIPPVPGAGIGRPPSHDWDALRLRFIKGGDEFTIQVLSEQPGSPTLQMLYNRSSAEGWLTLRQQFRQEVLKHTMHLESKLQAQVSMAAIEEVRERQAGQGIKLASAGMQLIDEIMSEKEQVFDFETRTYSVVIDPVTRKPKPGKRWQEAGLGTARMLVQTGGEIERKARGMEEYSVNLNDLNSPADLANYTPEQLMNLLTRLRKVKGMAHSASPLPLPGEDAEDEGDGE